MGQIISLIGTGMKATGIRNEADQRAGAHEYQAAVARNNAQIAEQNAQYAEQKGTVREGLQRERSQQFLGEEKAHIAGAGIEQGTGSVLRLQEDAARYGEVDALTVRNNAAREAYDWRAKGANQTAQADLYSWLAPQERHAGTLGYWSTVVGGIGNALGGSGDTSPGGGGGAGAGGGGGGGAGASEAGDWEGVAMMFA